MSIQLTVMSLDFDSTAAPFTKVFEKDEITVGRLPGNDLVLDKPEISGYHASLRVKEVDRSSAVFDVQEVLDAPLLVQTNPLQTAASSQYGIASDNLESFVSLFVNLLETEAKHSLQ